MLDRTCPPPVSHFAEISLHPEEVISLPNGIDIHIVNYGSAPASRLSVLIDGGANDYTSKAGVIIMAAALGEATTSLNPENLADLVDFNGAKLASGLSSHFASINLTALNSKIPNLLPVITDIISESEFPDILVESRARQYAANSAIMLQRVQGISNIYLQKLMCGENNPEAYVTMPEEFESVDKSLVESLFNTLKKSKLSVYVAGMLPDKLISEISDAFARFSPDRISPITLCPFTPQPPQRIDIDRPDSVQSAISMGIPTIERANPDYIPLRLAVMALGGYFGSRLMKNIREEKGLTYGINSALLGSYDGSYIQIEAQCDAAFVNQVIDETIVEIKRLAEAPPTGDELDRLRLHAWTNLAAAADTPFSTLDQYLLVKQVNLPKNYFTNQLDAISRLSSDTIARVAEKYIRPENLSIVTAGKL